MVTENEEAPRLEGLPRTDAGEAKVLLIYGSAATGQASRQAPFDRRASLNLDAHQAAADGLRSAFLALRQAGRATPGNLDIAAASAWVLKAYMVEETAIRRVEGAVGL